MFKGKRKNNRNEASSSRRETMDEVDINDIKLDNMRARNTPTREYDMKGDLGGNFVEDVDRVYCRSENAGSIGDVDDGPTLKRGLKARHVT